MSRFQKAMVWLGLTDAEDEEDRYEEYEDSPRRARHYRPDAPAQRPPKVQVFQTPPDQAREERDNIRRLASDRTPTRVSHEEGEPGGRQTALESRYREQRAAFVKPVPAEKPKLHFSQPQRFADVQEIGDSFRERQLVVVDLTNLPKELARRVIDFCSGVTYSLEGRIEKLSDAALLLSPANVELSSQDRDRLMERLGSGTENR